MKLETIKHIVRDGILTTLAFIVIHFILGASAY